MKKIVERLRNPKIRRLVVNSISAIFALATLITVTVAWYIPGGVGSSVSISTANVDSSIDVYKGIDFNYDGYLDKENNLDKYESNKLTSKKDETTQITSTFLEMEDILPSKIYTWKIVATNQGDADAYFYGALSDTADSSKLQYFEISLATLDSNKNVVSRGTWKTMTSGGKIFSSPEVISWQAGTNQANVQTFVIQIRMTNSDEAYQQLQGTSFAVSAAIDVVLSTEKPE